METNYILEIIKFLDTHSGSLTFLVTAVYVFATIFICRANIKAAKAATDQIEVTKRQIKESIDQFNAVNRPFVTVRFDIIRSGLLCFVIENEGPLPAHNVKIRINKEFLENIKDADEKTRLEELNESSLYLASKQKITVLLGGNLSFDDIAAEIAKIDISYDGFNEHTEIDINQYRFMIIYRSPVEDASQHLKKMQENNKAFHRALLKAMDKPGPVQNIIVHSATEKDADKFRIFKEVCLTSHLTASQLAEKLNMEQEYVLKLLYELQKIDRLVSYTFHEVTTDYSKALWYKR